MADLSTKKDPLHLRDERPDYVEDKSGETIDDGDDLSETVQPAIDTDPQDTGSLGVEKPTVHVDMDKVDEAEEQGRGM